ncbi:MAG: Rrf2 family transcriptional regulator [Lachnospiraceae bacterium]|nr:Rrf2 family transcriptional regulator [Lachnospiraceae bacterium]MDY5741695.1 Rrf2 family transcriptional regulator [Lachnospiraceae bacterium]
MRLSTRGRYGLRALLDLAANEGTEPVSIKSISKRQGISESYLAQLFAKLKKSGIIKSERGANGGYRMCKDVKEVSIGEVLRSLEGNIEPVNCLAYGEHPTCKVYDICSGRIVWKRINDAVNHAVDGIMLSDIVEETVVYNEELLKRNEPIVRDCCN